MIMGVIINHIQKHQQLLVVRTVPRTNIAKKGLLKVLEKLFCSLLGCQGVRGVSTGIVKSVKPINTKQEQII